MKSVLFVVPAVGLTLSASASMAQQAAPAAQPEAVAAEAPQPPTQVTSPAATDIQPASSVAPAVAAIPAAPLCEIHVWPAARVDASTQGAGMWFGLIGGLIDAAAHADQNKRDKAFITSALDSAAQARALKEMDLPKILNLPAANVITHDQGIELTDDNAGRLAQSSASCYYDVVIRQLAYLKTATTKGKMRTFILVRGADGTKRVINYKDSANHALDVKLPNEGEDTTAASTALIDAFKADVTEFSDKFVRKTASKS